MKKITVSVVIPVFNEEHTIATCLDALLAQTVQPHEIIVVDNNSTDGTVEVLKKYAPQITLLHEPRAGVVFARTTGFNAATGDVIGRLDADSRVTPGWVARVQEIFSHGNVDAVTGAIHYYDMPRLANKFDRVSRRIAVVKKEEAYFLHGTNMALTRAAWQKVRGSLCMRNGIHEDLDVAIHLRKMNAVIRFTPQLVASVSARRLDDSWRDFYRYASGNLRTYEEHDVTRKKQMFFVMILLVIFHGPLRAIHRGYNPKNNTFSWRNMLFGRIAPRKNPLDG